MRLCPDCLESPAPDQREGSRRDGRCKRCIRELCRRRRLADQYYDAWYERTLA